MKEFSIKEALSAGWEAFKSRIGFFIGLLLLCGLISIIPQFVIQQIVIQPNNIVWLAVILSIINIIFTLFQYFLYVGIIKISLTIADGGDPQIGDLFSGGSVFVPYLLGSMLFGLIVVGGSFLLIVPGIIFFIMFHYYDYFIVDKKMGPVEALKASAALTKGVRWNLLGFGLILGLLNLGGFLLVFVGLFVTIPVSMVANAFVYRKLLPQTQFV